MTPTPQQQEALERIVHFLLQPNNQSVFILKGYAGTGKSSLIGALVGAMTKLNQKTTLLAPTGRAAKVFAQYAHRSAFTIHKKIYRQQVGDTPYGAFMLDVNLYKNTLFIIDESSMIGEGTGEHSPFGTGNILNDLVSYIYSGENCRALFVGDTAQLPPVGEEHSPALQTHTFTSFGLDAEEYTLTQVVRQDQSSGILHNATMLRSELSQRNTLHYPKIDLQGFTDIIALSGRDFVEELNSAYYRDGREETIVITQTNRYANICNNGIRNQILQYEDDLSQGDILQIVKNNYFVLEKEAYEQLNFLANGEMMEVVRSRNYQEVYGFRFCNATLKHIDYPIEIDTTIILDTLQSPTAALTREQQNRLFEQVMQEYQHISRKRERLQKLKQDPFYNALQTKYGYALTCHKAQGGEWKNVFLIIESKNIERMGDNFYRWLYTAFTRATKRLYLVNFPSELQ